MRGVKAVTTNRGTARAEVRVSARVNGALHVHVTRRYVYDRPNCEGETAQRVVTLRPLLIAVAMDTDDSWGVAWSLLFDALVEVQQAGPYVIEVQLGPAPPGEAGVLFRCLVQTVAHELQLPVVRENDGRQLALFQE